MKGDARGYCLAGGADSVQGVCLVVVVSWHMEELAPFEIPAELLHEEMKARHVASLASQSPDDCWTTKSESP